MIRAPSFVEAKEGALVCKELIKIYYIGYRGTKTYYTKVKRINSYIHTKKLKTSFIKIKSIHSRTWPATIDIYPLDTFTYHSL